MQPNSTWNEVWAGRRLDSSRGTLLEQLLAADGFDTGFGSLSAEQWSASARRRASDLGMTSESSVFEVGCGAGAFLYELRQLGCAVAGIDRSPALIKIAGQAIPDGSFAVGDAARLPEDSTAEFVVSYGVFLYFPSLPYARDVIAGMARMATRAVAVLDIPDLSHRHRARAEREAELGGADAYRERYAGLEHLYFDRGWMRAALEAAGLRRVRILDQDIPGYRNGGHRFNAWGFVEPPHPASTGATGASATARRSASTRRAFSPDVRLANRR